MCTVATDMLHVSKVHYCLLRMSSALHTLIFLMLSLHFSVLSSAHCQSDNYFLYKLLYPVYIPQQFCSSSYSNHVGIFQNLSPKSPLFLLCVVAVGCLIALTDLPLSTVSSCVQSANRGLSIVWSFRSQKNIEELVVCCNGTLLCVCKKLIRWLLFFGVCLFVCCC